jgi:hypothetical protein
MFRRVFAVVQALNVDFVRPMNASDGLTTNGRCMDDQRTDRERRAMSTPLKCTACNGINLQPGRIADFSSARFAPDGERTMSLCRQVQITAMSCLDCGAIALSADPDKVRAAVSERRLEHKDNLPTN